MTEPTIIPGVFRDRESAQRAVEALREHGFGQAAIGLALAEPGRYFIADHVDRDAVEGISKGVAYGAPLGVIAGLAVTGAVAATGSPIGLAGILVGIPGGAIFGAFAGVMGGLAAKVKLDDHADRWCEIPLQGDDILLVVRAGDRSAKVRAIMEGYGARCFLDEAVKDDGP